MNIILIDSLIGNDYTICLADALNNEGVKVTLITPSNREIKSSADFNVKKWIPSKDPAESSISKLAAYPVFLLKTLILVYRQKQPVIHFQFFRFKTDIFFLVLLSLLGRKTVYTAHNIFPHERKNSDLWLNYILYKFAWRIILHSETVQRKLLDNFNINPAKTAIVPHGNFDIYKPSELPTQNEAREYFNLNSGDKVLLFFGYIKEYKGLDLLLKAFKLLSEEGQAIKLLIAGYPATKKLWESYSQIIEEIRDKSNIILRLEFIPSSDVALYFSAADYVVLPYKRIDHSGIIHLAYSFNKPVIATMVGDFQESIDEGKSGFLVNSQDEKDLAITIKKALENYDNISDMGEYISFLNRTRYSWEEAAKKTIKVYEGI